MKEQLKEAAVKETTDNLSRRRFLNYAGLAGAGLLIASCKKNDDNEPVITDDAIDFGSGDRGLLNYAFALEQLEAAFYTKVCSSFPAGLLVEQQQALMEIRDHEIVHREFLRNVLRENVIQDLQFDFSSVDFSDMGNVLRTAAEMESTGVSAYLGIVPMFTTAENMLAAMKIASVEGRHNAYIRESGQIGFVNTTDANSLDIPLAPNEVIAKTAKYFKETLSTRHLPK